jgi:hypothetical protein
MQHAAVTGDAAHAAMASEQVYAYVAINFMFSNFRLNTN